MMAYQKAKCLLRGLGTKKNIKKIQDKNTHHDGTTLHKERDIGQQNSMVATLLDNNMVATQLDNNMVATQQDNNMVATQHDNNMVATQHDNNMVATQHGSCSTTW